MDLGKSVRVIGRSVRNIGISTGKMVMMITAAANVLNSTFVIPKVKKALSSVLA